LVLSLGVVMVRREVYQKDHKVILIGAVSALGGGFPPSYHAIAHGPFHSLAAWLCLAQGLLEEI
jgi:hypothetical protein